MTVTHSWLKCQNAEFTTHLENSTAVISAHGELDAANADRLAERAARCIKHCQSLIIDVSGLDFVGTAGFSALHRINVMCSAADAHWALVPGRAVSRLLRICDPDAVLPTTELVPHLDEQQETPLLQLVP